MTDREDIDSALKHDLDALSKTYRSIEDEAPSSALDDSIRAAARKAVDARPQSLKKSWATNWTLPLSIAATVVLTVSVGTLVISEKPELAPPLPPVTEPVAESPMASPHDVPATAHSTAAMEVKKSAVPRTERSEKYEATTLLRKSTSNADADETRAPAPDATIQAAPTAEAEQQPAMRAAAKMSAPRNRSVMSAGAVADKSATESMPTLTESPEQWLDRIRLLRAQGKMKDAEETLKQFNKRYPNYPLPGDLAPPK